MLETVTMSGMRTRLNERGEFNIFLVLFIFMTMLFLGAAGFGVWAFRERNDYKLNTDQKVDAAVTVAVDKAKSAKENEFLEREKRPVKTYDGPESLGSIHYEYPKTWNGYEKDNESEMVMLMYTTVVSGNQDAIYALRVEVMNSQYDQVAKTYQSQVQTGKIQASPYRLEKLPQVVGARFEGQVLQGRIGTVILLPLRDKTIRIATDSKDFKADYENIVLKSFVFTP